MQKRHSSSPFPSLRDIFTMPELLYMGSAYLNERYFSLSSEEVAEQVLRGVQGCWRTEMGADQLQDWKDQQIILLLSQYGLLNIRRMNTEDAISNYVAKLIIAADGDIGTPDMCADDMCVEQLERIMRIFNVSYANEEPNENRNVDEAAEEKEHDEPNEKRNDDAEAAEDEHMDVDVDLNAAAFCLRLADRGLVLAVDLSSNSVPCINSPDTPPSSPAKLNAFRDSPSPTHPTADVEIDSPVAFRAPDMIPSSPYDFSEHRVGQRFLNETSVTNVEQGQLPRMVLQTEQPSPEVFSFDHISRRPKHSLVSELGKLLIPLFLDGQLDPNKQSVRYIEEVARKHNCASEVFYPGDHQVLLVPTYRHVAASFLSQHPKYKNTSNFFFAVAIAVLAVLLTLHQSRFWPF
jgi:hypothetical protein